jgi:hypothetical protein
MEARARAFQREVDRDAFAAWLVSDSVVSRAADYRDAIEWWKALHAEEPARTAFAYLPARAVVHATLYPVLKPQPNSYVFEIETDPAIFLYVDPDEPRSKIANTLAHELHHIGTAGVPGCEPAGIDSLPAGARTAMVWLTGFAEGLAALAAAPHLHFDGAWAGKPWAPIAIVSAERCRSGGLAAAQRFRITATALLVRCSIRVRKPSSATRLRSWIGLSTGQPPHATWDQGLARPESAHAACPRTAGSSSSRASRSTATASSGASSTDASQFPMAAATFRLSPA